MIKTPKFDKWDNFSKSRNPEIRILKQSSETIHIRADLGVPLELMKKYGRKSDELLQASDTLVDGQLSVLFRVLFNFTSTDTTGL